MSEIRAVECEPLDVPLEEPFEISLGVQHEASNVLVTVETADGTVGYGEGSPLPPVTGETQRAALATAEAAAEVVTGRPVENYGRLVREVRTTFPGMVSATFAVETAILDAYCREVGIPMAELFGNAPSPVETDMTVPILPPEEAADRAADAVAAGYRRLKVKTGSGLDADVDRVAAVADAAPDAALKVDANQGWSPKETERFAARVDDRGIELDLVEQPVPASDVAGLADARERVSVPVAADESVFTPQDAVRIVRERAADVLNVKLGKSGPLAAGDIVSIAEGADLDLMVGCMLETAVGIHASAHVVAGTDAFAYVDLDGNRLLAEDVIDADDGPVHDVSGPGHGVTPDI